MSNDLADARKKRLFNPDALTKILWAPPVTRKYINHLVSILENEPLFRKQDKYSPFLDEFNSKILPESKTVTSAGFQNTGSTTRIATTTWMGEKYFDCGNHDP